MSEFFTYENLETIVIIVGVLAGIPTTAFFGKVAVVKRAASKLKKLDETK